MALGVGSRSRSDGRCLEIEVDRRAAAESRENGHGPRLLPEGKCVEHRGACVRAGASCVDQFTRRRNAGLATGSSDHPLTIEETPAALGADRTGRHEAVQLGAGELLVVGHRGRSIWGRGSLCFEPRLEAGSGRSAVSRYGLRESRKFLSPVKNSRENPAREATDTITPQGRFMVQGPLVFRAPRRRASRAQAGRRRNRWRCRERVRALLTMSGIARHGMRTYTELGDIISCEPLPSGGDHSDRSVSRSSTRAGRTEPGGRPQPRRSHEATASRR